MADVEHYLAEGSANGGKESAIDRLREELRRREERLQAAEALLDEVRSDRENRFALRTQVCERIRIETVREDELYATYLIEDERKIGPVGYYVDELDAREGHLRWVKPNWHDLPPEAQRPLRLLLAEDNPDDVAVAYRVFGASPRWEMIVVGDGQQALDLLCRRRSSSDESVWFPDLVMLNLQMPKRTGHEVLEAMKADPKLSALPVVMWSV
jgi:CheY-like chemotaxis protein